MNRASKRKVGTGLRLENLVVVMMITMTVSAKRYGDNAAREG